MKIVFMASLGLLCGCSIFAPSYVKEADTRATKAYEELSIILAKSDLGVLTDKNSYPDYIDSYATIIGLFETASLAVGGSPESNSQGVLARSIRNLDGLIDDCMSQVKTFAEEHRKFGVPQASGIAQPVRVACDQALKAIRATR